MATTRSTRVVDIVVPSVYLPYFDEQSILKNDLITSGIVVQDPRMNALAQSGGQIVNMPFFQDLSGTAQVPSSAAGGATDTDMNVHNIGTSTDKAHIIKRQMAWGSEDLAAELAGADPMRAIADMDVNWWMGQEQTILINILKGVFATACSDLTYSAHTTSATAYAANPASFGMKADHIVDTQVLLGDASGSLSAIAMHSIPFARLQKENLITFVKNSEQGIFFPYYLGYRVIVNDNCPTATAGDTTNYTSYLFGRGAIARGEGLVKVPVEVYRKPLASLDVLIRRRAFILHPRGVAYGATPTITPTTAELATGSNWTRVFEKKNMRIASLITNA